MRTLSSHRNSFCSKLYLRWCNLCLALCVSKRVQLILRMHGRTCICRGYYLDMRGLDNLKLICLLALQPNGIIHADYSDPDFQQRNSTHSLIFLCRYNSMENLPYVLLALPNLLLQTPNIFVFVFVVCTAWGQWRALTCTAALWWVFLSSPFHFPKALYSGCR